MKKRLMIALMLALCCLAACAAGQTLPGVEVFSPGLVRLCEKTGDGEQVQMQATMTAANIAYARDLSVLSSMLSGTTFEYAGWGGFAQGGDRLSIVKNDETLLALGLDRSGTDAALTLNGQAFAVDLSGTQYALGTADALAGTSILERVPLASVCAWIEGLSVGDRLPCGFAVTQAFAVERTMSDDGTRLTRIDISGSIAREGEEPWVIAGYLRQPAGRSPKDTFELTAVQSEDNTLELSYSSLRQSEITRKDKAGTASVDTTLKAAGKLDGSKVTSRLTVYLRNAWTADGESLNERITVSATLGHTDSRPGLRMQRLNDISAKLHFVLGLTTQEAGDEVIGVSDDATLSIVLDGNTFLDCAADMTLSVGGQPAQESTEPAGTIAPQEALEAAVQDAVVALARGLYPTLSESAKNKAESGL